MSATTGIKPFWLLVAAIPAFALGGLLFRGCGKTSPDVVTRYLSVNLDSLKATIPPDTIKLPGNQITRIVRVPVLLSDTMTVDSLTKAFRRQISYYEELIRQLRGDDRNFGWDWSESIVLQTKENFYADSVSTPTYFHKWNITAEGPIKGYTYQVIPFCPVPAILTPKKHHLLLGLGGLVQDGLIRPIYSAGYGYKFLRIQGGYIPKTATEKGAFQIQAGLDVPIK